MGRSQAVRGGGDARFGPGGDDTGCPILHVDMDAFYASVEVRARPELRGRPVVVGGLGPRGVVSSASYEARQYGVRSAMPTARARALCPGAVYLPPDFTAYSAASRAVMEIFSGVTPLVEPLSLDEAFLDVGGAGRLLGRPAAIAASIRRRIADELGLTCSVGVAPTKFVAKLGSTLAKPDGMIVVPVGQVLEFLHPLPVAALWGVGERAAEALRRFGLNTVSELAHAPGGLLRQAVGEAAAAHLHELAWGRDPRAVEPEQVEKSIGAEVTFDTDVSDPLVIRRALLALSDKVAARLRAAGQAGRTVSIKVRLADFRTVNRSRTLLNPTDVGREVFETAWSLFEVLRTGDPAPSVELFIDPAGSPRRVGTHPGGGGGAADRAGTDPGEGAGPSGRPAVREGSTGGHVNPISGGSGRLTRYPGEAGRAGGRRGGGRPAVTDRIRLVGVRVEGLASGGEIAHQLVLGSPDRGWREAEAAADAAAARFGRSVVRPASLIGRDDLRREENPPRPSVVPLSDPRSPS